MIGKGLGSLLVKGAVAYGIYKLINMSAEQRNNLISKGKELISENLGGLKDKVSNSNGTSHGSPSGSYGENTYTGTTL